MAANEVCAGCRRDNEEEIAVSWCNDCDEPVCRPCSKVHRRFVIPHDVVDIKQIPNVSKALSKTCKDHTGQKLIFFCVNHDKIVCPSCLSESHKECDINHIEKAAKGIRDSTVIHDLKDRLHNQKGALETVKKEYNELSSKINQNKGKQHDRLIQLRSIIEDRLNELERNIETHYIQDVEKISSNTDQLESLAQTTQANLQVIEKVETEESEVNLFHLVKHLDTSQLSDEENLQYLENDISNMSLEFIPENFIEKVVAMLNEFGTDSQTSLNKRRQSGNKARQSQICVHSDEKQSVSQSRILHAGKSSKFYACCIIDENEVIVIEEQTISSSDRQHEAMLCLQSINLRVGTKSTVYQIDNKEIDCTYKDTICNFDRKYILVSMQPLCICVIDLDLKRVARRIEVSALDVGDTKELTSTYCFDGQILILLQEEEDDCHIFSKRLDSVMYFIDFNGKLLKKIPFQDEVCDVDINEERIYCTFCKINDITDTTFSGERTTCYTSLDLKESCKIAACDNVIFLLEKERDTIYRVDLKTKQRLAFHKDEIDNATHMNSNKQTKQIAVTCDGGKCLKIYKI